MSPPPKKPTSKRPPSKKSEPKGGGSKTRRAKLASSAKTSSASSSFRASSPSGAERAGWRKWLFVAGERRKLESFGWWVVALALLLPPAVMLGGLRDPFRLPKQLLTELLVPISCVFLAFGLRRLERVEWRRLLALPAVRVLGPLWLVSVVSALLSAHPEHAREAMWSSSIGMLAVLVWSVGLPRKRLLFDLLLLSGGVLAAIAILQHHEIFRPFEFARASRRVQLSSLAGNAADLGAYLVLPLLGAQAMAVRALAARRWLHVAGAVAIALVLLYAILLGQTISAIAAFFASTAVFWLLRTPGRWRLPILGSAIVVGVLGLLLVAPARQRLGMKIRQLQSGEMNDVLTGRLDGWRAGADMMARHPILGVGPGAYRAEFSTTKLEMIDDGATFWSRHTDGSLFGNAHNEMIELGADLGVLGLLALGWGVWVVLGELRRRPVAPSFDPVDADRRALEWAGLVSLAVLSTTYFPLRTALVAYPYVFLLAWVLEPRAVSEEEGDHEVAAEAAMPAEAAA